MHSQARTVVWMKLKDPLLLKLALLGRGFSHRQLATACGRNNHGMIGHLASGRRTSCSTELAAMICKTLEVPIDLIFLPESSTESGEVVKAKRKVA